MNGYVNEEIIEEIDNNIDKESNIIKAKFVKNMIVIKVIY